MRECCSLDLETLDSCSHPHGTLESLYAAGRGAQDEVSSKKRDYCVICDKLRHSPRDVHTEIKKISMNALFCGIVK